MSYPIDVSPSLLKTLQVLALCGACSNIVAAKAARIGGQQMATRIWRLRQLGLALKLGPERYDISELGKDRLRAIENERNVSIRPLIAASP